jgi:predicted phosphodiesterase
MTPQYAPIDPPIRFLFRYRDLVGSTLDEHRKVLLEHEKCWWGWWKRPSEDERFDVWNELDKEIAENGSATIGLFDSGAESDDVAVRRATINRVISPVEGANAAPPIPADDKELVPQYYRNSPYSRAWMRITKFDDRPLKFFGEYSYAAAPRLPGIPERYLERVRDKRVVDQDELRAMDTTIWHVRPAVDPDRTEKFLAPAIRITEAISREPIRVNGNAILHISDMHFAEKRREQHVWGYPNEAGAKQTLSAALTSLASQLDERAKIGVIVISGDFTFVASDEEFKQASHSIRQLLGVLDLGADNVVIVPGNHDIKWTKDAGDTYQRGAPVDNAPAEARKAYIQFYKDLLQHAPNQELAMGRRFVFANGAVVEICALNSSSLEQGANFLAGMGRIEPHAFDLVSSGLDWKRTPNSLALRMLVVHHHVTATEDVEDPAEFYKGFGMAIDAKQTLRAAARAGVQLVLHGHRHRAFVWTEGIYELPEHTQTTWDLGRIAVLGAGSAGSKDVESDSHFVNLLKIDRGAMTVDMYRSTKRAAFERMQTWTAAFDLAAGRLVLDPWGSEPLPS